jgi:hydrogenase nickel incorporation protein HypA/HybF
MHEIGIMESAIAAVLDQARRRDARQVHRIVLRIGSLSGVEPDSLRFAFESVVAGTLADGAALEIETVPALARCAACGIDFEAEAGFIFSCPRCRRFSGDLRQGREIELSKIELS